MATILTWLTKGGEFKVVQFDVITSYTSEGSSSITDHAVEIGAAVSDHSRPEPERLSLEGYMSGKPLLSDVGKTGDQDAVFQLLAYQQKTLIDLPQAFALIGTKPMALNPPSPPIQPNVAGLVNAGIGALFGGALSATLVTRVPVSPKATQATTIQATAAFFNRVYTMWEVLRQARLEASRITVISSLEYMENMLIERIAVPRTVADGSGASFQMGLKHVRFVTSATVSAPQPAEVRGQAPVNKGSQATKLATPAQDHAAQESLALYLGKKSGLQK